MLFSKRHISAPPALSIPFENQYDREYNNTSYVHQIVWKRLQSIFMLSKISGDGKYVCIIQTKKRDVCLYP